MTNENPQATAATAVATPQTPAPAGGAVMATKLSPLQIAGLAVLLVVLLITGLGIYWSIQPSHFDVRERLVKRIDQEGPFPPGAVTVSTVIGLAETLLYKPGGYLSNDISPPGNLIDNMPNWEFGLLTELRDSARSLRQEFSRSQSQSIENDFLRMADSQFNFNERSWILPSTEGEYKKGIRALENYLQAMLSGDQNARFFARTDNLVKHLQVIERRLGNYAQLLSASVNDPELLDSLVVATEHTEQEGAAMHHQAAQILERTPWNEIDDRFYEARGYTWALLHMMEAFSIDFAEVLRTKNAEVSMQQILRDLRGATQRKWSPVVLNGHGFGVLANHSLIMAGYISRANSAVKDLREVLLH